MKKVNGLTVYEENDICALDEYSQQLAADIQDKMTDEAYDDTDINEQIDAVKEDIKGLKNKNTAQDSSIQSIQEDIEAIQADNIEQSEEITELKETIAEQSRVIALHEKNAKKAYVEPSTHITVHDAAEMDAQVNLHGTSTQATRSGKNKFQYGPLAYEANCVKMGDLDNGYWYKGNTTEHTGEGIWGKGWISLPTVLEANTRYIISFDIQQVSEGFTNNIFLGVYRARDNSDGGRIANSATAITTTKQRVSVTLTARDYDWRVRFELNSNEVKITNIMITTADEEDQTYEEYGVSPSTEFPSEIKNVTGNVNITANEQIVEFPLAEGQRLMQGDYLADDGVHHKRTQKILDGTENWVVTGKGFRWDITGAYAITQEEEKNTTVDYIISNAFPLVKLAEIWIYGNTGITAIIDPDNAEGQRIVIGYEGKTLIEFKAWLAEQYAAGTPVIIEYELAEEEIEPYNEEQQQAYDKLQKLTLCKGTNNIFCIDEVPAEVDLHYTVATDMITDKLAEDIAEIKSMLTTTAESEVN